MTAPLCIGCRVQRVKRRYGLMPQKRGERLESGIRWRWFCSRWCASRAMGLANLNSPTFKAACQACRTRAQAKVLSRLVHASKGELTAEGLVDPKVLIKVVMGEIRLAYSRGYTAGSARREYAERKRKVAA